MTPSADTIAAIATAPGRGGIGIVRVSGPQVAGIARTLLGSLPTPRFALHAVFLDEHGEAIDAGLALYFPAPASFTGEDVLELHGHGGMVVLDRVLARVLALGARPARPGEFSERAFLNGKMDLAQAEAIADLIDSASTQAARAAMRSLAGVFSESVRAVVDAVAELRAFVEAAIDFPEEEVDFLAVGDLDARTCRVIDLVRALRAEAAQGARLRDGLRVVIAGAPNAGKSSLLNRLAGRDTAIVTAVAGTTRDVLKEELVLDGVSVQLVDTAGLREGGDAIELEGMRRAQLEIRQADRVLWVVDASAPELPVAPMGTPMVVVRNKIDLTGEPAGRVDQDPPLVCVSALDGSGMVELVAVLRSLAGGQSEGGSFSARRRHLDALDRADHHLAMGLEALRTARAGELLAEELRAAQAALGEITGEVTTEDLLGQIFGRFCIGK